MNQNDFIEKVNELGINLSDYQIDLFQKYLKFLQEYNNKTNLTRIINENDIYLKHFYDSICIFKSGKINSNTYICDLGTGAGFPGVVISIINPSIVVDLVESNGKKCEFLKELKTILKLENVNIINERAEILGRNSREKYDIVTSRAVASLKVLSELSIPLLKVNGYFIPLKGNVDEEIIESKTMLKNLFSEEENRISYTLPYENSNRNILIIKKLKSTNLKYPREYSKIKKS